MKNSTPIALDRLATALQKHGVRLKRMQLLQAVASAFGYRNTHELAAADAAGDLRPPAAHHVMTAGVPGIGDMMFIRDPDGNVFGIDQTAFLARTDRSADWLVSPFGGLLDAAALRVADDEPDISAPYRFTNGCGEIEMAGGGVVNAWPAPPPIDPEQPAYMTNACCETASVTQADLEGLGLPFGQFDGGFYPLTPDEEQYIAEDVVDSDDGLHSAMTGYSVLYRGAKCLMPTMEIANRHESDSALEDFPPREQVLADAVAYADRIRPRLEAMGGNVLVDTDQDDRVLVLLIVPFAAAMAIGDKHAWWKHLAWLMVDPDLPTTLRQEFSHTGKAFRASVSWIGEGEDGDYDPERPGDRPLLRFDAHRLVEGSWTEVDSGSYCTQVPAWSQPSIARALARHVVDSLEDEGGTSPKRLLEGLSWIDAATVEAARQQQLVLDAMVGDDYAAHRTYGNPDRGTSVDLRRRADGSIRCEVYVDLDCAAVLEARDIDEVRAWLKTLPSDQDDPGDGSRTAHALAPQWDFPDTDTVRWMLVDGNEDESDWFEPGETYPFDKRFILIDDMTV